MNPLRPKRGAAVRLVSLARPHAWRLTLAGICQLLSSAAILALPYVVSMLINSVFVEDDPTALNRIALSLLGVVASAAVFGYVRGYLSSYAGNRIVSDLRQRLYSHLQRLPVSFYDERRTGEIMSRLTNDAMLVQTVVANGLISFIQQILMLVAVVVLVLTTDWRLALVALAAAPLMVLAVVLVGQRTVNLAEQTQEELASANTVLEETLSAVRVVKAFGREDYEVRRYAAAVRRALSAAVASARLQALFTAVVTAAGLGAVTVVLWFGGHQVLAGRLSPGELVAFLLYLMLLIAPLQTLANLNNEFQQALGAARRIFELLDEDPAAGNAYETDVLPPAVKGRLEVRNVHFAYTESGREVLGGVSFSVEPGQTVALVGPSGAGKTTLISLLMRFYEPVAGRILIDGHDITKVKVGSLRAVMGIVPQDATLFGSTVRENIAYGRAGASDTEIEEAARAANAHEFVAELPQGYDTLVGERGVKLSGGQRQRIAVARAVLKDPRILILDEATSSLDNESESLVQDALERLMVGRTTVVIAHRLTTVERADNIVVLDAGRVVEQGTHAELLAHGGLYQRLYNRNFAHQGSGDAALY